MDYDRKARISTSEENTIYNRSVSRREFLRVASIGAVGLAGWPVILTSQKDILNTRKKQLPRVLRVHSNDATFWDYSTGHYWEYIDEPKVHDMLNKGICKFTGKDDLCNAWSKVMESYSPGDKIAIKINCNASYTFPPAHPNEIDATAPILNAVLAGLVNCLNVPPEDIYVYDAQRLILSTRIRDKCSYEVNFVQRDHSLAVADPAASIDMRNVIYDGGGNPITCYMPLVLTQAQHLINICLLKNHRGCLQTGALKNHLGTVKPDPMFLHPTLHESMVDLNLNTHIKDKTRLFVADGLFGAYDWWFPHEPQPWPTFPNGSTPNSIFLALDPVALDSVLADYVQAERESHGLWAGEREYLENAMEQGLGVYEQRDSQGNYHQIEYIEVELGPVNRNEIDRAIRRHKEGHVTDEEVQGLIEQYYRGD